MSTQTDLYEHDFYAWTQQQVQLLRAGKMADLDFDHLAEELEEMGGNRESELENRLGILLAHLLKWRYQPQRHSNSWKYTVKEQRRRVDRLLKKNPSLKARLSTAFENAYGDAVLIAARETGLEEEQFPATSPFTLEQVLDDAYWPA